LTDAGKNQEWWCTPVIPAFGRLRQEDLEFKANVGYIVSPCLKKPKKKNPKAEKRRELSGKHPIRQQIRIFR
jgi:hypothetical protein